LCEIFNINSQRAFLTGVEKTGINIHEVGIGLKGFLLSVINKGFLKHFMAKINRKNDVSSALRSLSSLE